MNAIRQVAQLAGLVLAIFVILPLGQSDAKDWKLDVKGYCPGAWADSFRRGCIPDPDAPVIDKRPPASGYKAEQKQICLQNCRADCTKNHSDDEANLRKCRTSCAQRMRTLKGRR